MIDKARSEEVIGFIENLKQVDDFYGQPFLLLKWQREILKDVYGTVKKDGRRQYQYAYLEVPKKNGKTTLIGALCVYHATMDAPGGQIYCCAADREQASLTYNAAAGMIEQDRFLKKILKINRSQKQIINRKTGTFVKVLSAEAYTKHGLNPTVVIFDELHAQPNRDLWDVMTFGAGAARKEPLWWIITTAGDDPDKVSIGWEVHERATKLVSGEIKDPIWYVKIYGAPDDTKDIFDEKVWKKANPSLGQTISLEAVRSEAAAAKTSEASEKLFRWLRLNQWVSLKTMSWLPLSLYDENKSKLTKEDLRGLRCYVGIDLSSTTDLTAIGYVFPPQGDIDKYIVMSEQWIPEENTKVRIKRDKVPYDIWAKKGYVQMTKGDVIDYEYIKEYLGAIENYYEPMAFGNDPWGGEKLRQDLEREFDIELFSIKQSIEIMSPTMKEFERLIKNSEIEFVDNPCTRWAFGNVTLVTDGNENYKAKKISKINRMDPIIAILNALYLCIKIEGSIDDDEERTVRVI